ncbi:MAG: response regulator transcription factor [Bryobacteraceae bacterium]|jgi:DNA-binding NarL/FixJ family response regulator
MGETPAITVVLVDDHAIVREGLAALCAANGMTVIGQAGDGPSALETIASLKPDFVILDLRMPGMTGAEVIRRLRADGCAAKLLVLSVSREGSTVIEALRAGADAYLLKDGPGRHLLEAIQFVQDGGVYISPLLRGAGLFTRTDKGAAHNPITCLSPRETEVFSHLVNGLRAKDIAELLDISPKTVDTYRASLMRKLNVHDLVGLVKFAIEQNLTGTSGSR